MNDNAFTTLPPRLARWTLATLTALSTAAALHLFHRTLEVGGLNVAEFVLLAIFTLLFAWIAFSFWTATLGLVLVFLGTRDSTESVPPPSLVTLHGRTAILMPIYNEDPQRVFAGVEAMVQSLIAAGHAADFDLYVLSDTTDADIWLEEETAWAGLMKDHVGRPHVYYRHRPRNIARKSGNIADFCIRWGSHYDYMLVLDADSLMEGATFVEMVRRMDADPRLGILQVPPTPINRLSLFARMQQFASRLYGRVFIRGFAGWAQFDSNYWGHNAIIRIRPFIEHCGLPLLPGKAPLGGEILSHDFVEAALLSRAGWKVCLAEDLDGSYEECPTTLLDFAKRDQRWCQGNMQHIRLVFSEGFRPISRMHLASGAMSYLASPLWMLFLLMGAVAMLLDGAADDGPRAVRGAVLIFSISMTLLLLPKLWSVIALAAQPRFVPQHGGWKNVILSVLLESLLSVIVAPIMMLFHSRFVVTTLLGEKVQWTAQNRGDGHGSLWTALRQYRFHTLCGIGLTAVVAWLVPGLLPWFVPLVAGLVLAAPLSLLLDSVTVGQALARRGLLLIPEEVERPQVVRMQSRALQRRTETNESLGRGKLFAAVLSDPSFFALHCNILAATDAGMEMPAADLRTARAVLEERGAAAISGELRGSILSDAVALKSLHVHLRARLPFVRAAG